METSQENVTENLAAAAVEGEVKGSDYETQKGDMKEEHDGLVKGFDRKDGQMNGEIEIDSSDVMENVVETEVIRVEGKEEVLGMNDLEGGEEAEKGTSGSDGPVVGTEIVSVEEKREMVEDMDVLEGVKEAEKGIVSDDVPAVTENFIGMKVVLDEEKGAVQEMISVEEKEEIVEDMDVFEEVKEAEKGIISDDVPAVTENFFVTKVVLDEEKGAVQQMISVEEKEEIVEDMDVFEGVKEAEKGIVDDDDGPAVVTENFVENEVVLVEAEEKEEIEENGVQKVGEAVMNINDEKSENSDEEDDDDGENDHVFAVGDFVWGKVKTYPWWPGQIFDPSDASKYAEKLIVKGCFLVAYFGDDSFSWCRKSQLKRFAENFDEMSRQNNSKNFLHAVAEAVDGFSRAVEMEMSSLYLPLENHIWDYKARNRGIKAGVVVPRGDYLKLFLTRLEPEKLLGNLRHAAKTGFAASPLEIRVLKSWLAGFYHRKGGFALAEFHEPVPVEGLEDKMGNGVFVPIKYPVEEEESTAIQTSEDKVYRRKRKSVADILEEDMVGIELMQGREDVNEMKSDKKKRKKDFGSEKGGDNSSVKKSNGKRGRKRKSETETRSPVSVQNGVMEEKGEKNDEKEETLESFSSRKKKKSKYLSAPYTTPDVTISKMGERMTRVAGQLIGSTPVLTSCSSQSIKKRSKKVDDDDIDVNEVLSVVTDAAVDPLNTSGVENLDQITGFVSAFRTKESAGEDGRKTRIKEGEVSLLITFPPSVTLPTKDSLFELFGKFGEINETETGVFPNSFSAQVAFVRKSDAEEAYNECLKNSYFGDGNINYRLLFLSSSQIVSSSVHKKTGEKKSTGLRLVTKKLHKLTSEVEKMDGQVTAEMKRKIEGELKDILAEVSILPESSSP